MDRDYFPPSQSWSSDRSFLNPNSFPNANNGGAITDLPNLAAKLSCRSFNGQLARLPLNSNEESSACESGETMKRKAISIKDERSNSPKEVEKTQKPPRDYIHVRARRGQATDSHSLAERVRREKISERMKLLQDLVPGCDKVTGKALMLDEIINYVQSLQRQVEFLSMKLASVNPGLDFNVENLLSKDMFQQKTTPFHQMYPLDSSAPAFYHNHNVQQQQLYATNIISGPLGQCSVDSLPFDGFNQNIPQLPDDLDSIVRMEFVQNSVQNKTRT